MAGRCTNIASGCSHGRGAVIPTNSAKEVEWWKLRPVSVTVGNSPSTVWQSDCFNNCSNANSTGKLWPFLRRWYLLSCSKFEAGFRNRQYSNVLRGLGGADTTDLEEIPAAPVEKLCLGCGMLWFGKWETVDIGYSSLTVQDGGQVSLLWSYVTVLMGFRWLLWSGVTVLMGFKCRLWSGVTVLMGFRCRLWSDVTVLLGWSVVCEVVSLYGWGLGVGCKVVTVLMGLKCQLWSGVTVLMGFKCRLWSGVTVLMGFKCRLWSGVTVLMGFKVWLLWSGVTVLIGFKCRLWSGVTLVMGFRFQLWSGVTVLLGCRCHVCEHCTRLWCCAPNSASNYAVSKAVLFFEISPFTYPIMWHSISFSHNINIHFP
jgi:hypothetical protein